MRVVHPAANAALYWCRTSSCSAVVGTGAMPAERSRSASSTQSTGRDAPVPRGSKLTMSKRSRTVCGMRDTRQRQVVDPRLPGTAVVHDQRPEALVGADAGRRIERQPHRARRSGLDQSTGTVRVAHSKPPPQSAPRERGVEGRERRPGGRGGRRRARGRRRASASWRLRRRRRAGERDEQRRAPGAPDQRRRMVASRPGGVTPGAGQAELAGVEDPVGIERGLRRQPARRRRRRARRGRRGRG